MNKLSGLLAQMCQQAGININERIITGHSGKVTCCTRLYEAKLDEQAITSRSGHRSNAVRAYKRPSAKLEQKISDVLQPPMPKHRMSDPSQSEGQKSDVKSLIGSTTNDAMQNTPHLSSHTEKSPIKEEDGILHIEVPSCISKIVITKNGKDITIGI